MDKSALVTVGTTEFEQLVKAIDTEKFIGWLGEFGYGKVVFQIGKGEHIPKLSQHYFRLDPDIGKRYEEADLIISHGGSGTLLQCLMLGKKIIAVVNDTLAGNHQEEIVKQLSKENYILGFNSVKELEKEESIKQIKEYLEEKAPRKDFRQACKGEERKDELLNQLIFNAE